MHEIDKVQKSKQKTKTYLKNLYFENSFRVRCNLYKILIIITKETKSLILLITYAEEKILAIINYINISYHRIIFEQLNANKT